MAKAKSKAIISVADGAGGMMEVKDRDVELRRAVCGDGGGPAIFCSL